MLDCQKNGGDLSLLNAVEVFFATLTKRRLKRGVFQCVVDLQAAINRFLDDHNARQSPSNGSLTEKNHRSRQTRAPSIRFNPLANALRAYVDGGGNIYSASAIRLLALTGARRSEIRTLRWREVDLALGLLVLRIAKRAQSCSV
jgi:integrase